MEQVSKKGVSATSAWSAEAVQVNNSKQSYVHTHDLIDKKCFQKGKCSIALMTLSSKNNSKGCCKHVESLLRYPQKVYAF